MSAGELRAQVRLADTALALEDAIREGNDEAAQRMAWLLIVRLGELAREWYRVRR